MAAFLTLHVALSPVRDASAGVLAAVGVVLSRAKEGAGRADLGAAGGAKGAVVAVLQGVKRHVRLVGELCLDLAR